MRKITCEHCVIRSESCIQDLPPDQLDEFHAAGTSAIYKPRQVVFHQGTPAGGLYVLCYGAVKLYQSDRFGREHILGVTAPGDVLGEMPLDESETYSTSAEALTESQLCYLPRERLVQFIQAHPMTGVRLIAALSRALSAARKKAGDLALKGAETRLAELLVHLVRSSGEVNNGSTHVTLAYSRRELAEMIGVSTETAIRLLGKLKRKHLLATHQRELTVTDFDRLSRLAGHGSIEAS
jgi:CRP-like cAMP-binding protein